MARSSREFRFESLEAFVFNKTGKRVRSYRRDMSSLMVFFLFDDGTEGMMCEGEEIERMQIYPVPKRMCVSCGGEPHVSQFDWQGRCHTALKSFWEKVRRVYWHRYSKSK